MKKLINSKFGKAFRKSYLKAIRKQIITNKEIYCCNVITWHRIFICWKDLKEVKENMNSEHLRTRMLKPTVWTCVYSWFFTKESRVKFLNECIDKFK